MRTLLHQSSGTVNETDTWIRQRSREANPTRLMDPMISLLPRHDIKPFNGDPLEWPIFIAAFKDVIHNVVPSDSQRLSMLRQLLKPEVQLDIGNTLNQPNMYWEALAELKNCYGHPHLVARAYMESLMKLPPVHDDDPATLNRFAQQLRGTKNILQTNGHEIELMSGVVL